ncbi:unnamed protein product, partial [Rotaria sp. Silwood2]
MAATAIQQDEATYFKYEDLISRVQTIQNQVKTMESILENRWNNKKTANNAIKSRSLTFIDPYGNSITNKYMDHEMIGDAIKKFKKTYIPKYLQKWIQSGIHDEQGLRQLDDNKRLSTVSDYVDGFQLVSFGQ